MKRIVILLLCAGLLCGLSLPAAAAAKGDVTGDNAVTAADARLCLRFAVDLEAPTTVQRAAADADGDGYITAADARLILRLAVGLDADFSAVLYATAHQYLNATANELPRVDYLHENFYRTIDKWCCYYTIHDVFRPALKKAGYAQSAIDKLAPNNYDSERIAMAIKNTMNSTLPKWMYAVNRSAYVPSLLLDYYRIHPEYAVYFGFRDYLDDVVTGEMFHPTENRGTYTPRIGDILFASNKERTYVNGIPTVDHTAQIIRLNSDGTFTCTDGCILPVQEGEKSRVRERTYVYSAARGTWVWDGNDIVQTLAIVRPDLDIRE